MRTLGSLSVIRRTAGDSHIYYVALHQHNALTMISSHLTRQYAEAMMKKLKKEFKDELKNYQSNQHYLVGWLINYVIAQYS